MAKKFIKGAIRRPGALTRKAKAAHMTVQAFARRHAHDHGLVGQESRFAITLSKLRNRKG
jgi:hypothetical protein